MLTPQDTTSPKQPPIRLGIIGGGMMCQIAHLPFYLADGRCEVVTLCETRPSLVAALRARAPGVKIVATPEAVFDDPVIDAVVVVAPRPAQAPLVLEALRAGKHVLMEKPMAHSTDQARRLVDAARAAGKTLAIGFMKRHDPGIEAARMIFAELRNNGRLGRFVYGRFFNFTHGYAVPPPPHQRPRESREARFAEWSVSPEWLSERWRDRFAWFMNSASHNVNLINFFLAEPINVASAYCGTDRAIMGALIADDVPVALECVQCNTGAWIEGFELLFERGKLTVTIPSPMAVDRASEVTLQEIGKATARMAAESDWSFARQARHFVSILTENAVPRTSGEDGLRDLELCEALWRKIVDLKND